MPSVLLAVDTDTDRALAQTRQLIDLFPTEELSVWILHLFGENAEGSSVAQVESVRRAEETLTDAGVSVTLRGESGDPATQIVEVAAKLNADAICVGGRERSPAGKALFGSVAQSVMLHSDKPVLFCRE